MKKKSNNFNENFNENLMKKKSNNFNENFNENLMKNKCILMKTMEILIRIS